MFINSIVYRKNASSTVFTQKPIYMSHLQDNIYWYSNTENHMSDIFYKRDKPDTRWCDLDTKHGKYHKKYDYVFMGIKPKYKWLYSYEVMKRMYDAGEVVIRNNKLKVYKENHYSQLNTWWDGLFNMKSGEYPTQKPTKLLRRIICLSTL